jgi:hypothetical protein
MSVGEAFALPGVAGAAALRVGGGLDLRGREVLDRPMFSIDASGRVKDLRPH